MIRLLRSRDRTGSDCTKFRRTLHGCAVLLTLLPDIVAIDTLLGHATWHVYRDRIAPAAISVSTDSSMESPDSVRRGLRRLRVKNPPAVHWEA